MDSTTRLQDVFAKFDTESAGHLNSAQYSAFIECLAVAHKYADDIKRILDDKMANCGKVTVSDLLSATAMVQALHPEEDYIAPSTKIIKILKDLKDAPATAEADKKAIDWGIEAILSGKLYQAELRTSDKSFAEERKARIIPWMENFSTPKMDPEVIEAHKKNYRHTRAVFTKIYPKGFELVGEPVATEISQNPPEAAFDKALDSIDFNVFSYEKAVKRKNVLPSIAYHILQKNYAFDYIDATAFDSFIGKVRDGYKEANQYHNDMHAADVVQMCDFMLQNGVKEIAKLDNLDVTALLISAIIHDFRHPGVNNGYLCNANSDLALLYNDQSVLENYHVSEAYKLIWKDKDCNIFGKLSAAEKKILRKRITGCVLGTDNAKHFEHANWLQGMISALEISKGKNAEKIINTSNSVSEFESKQQILVICMHAADVSNPTRPFEVAKEWAKRVTEEAYLQGDREKAEGIPVSATCNRETGFLPGSQMGFISGIARPYIEKLVEIFPKLQPMVDNINKGYQEWLKLSKPS